MKRLFHRHAIILAALLQVLPILRTVVTNPAAPSAFAIIMRWTVASTAALGAYDAFSAASTPYFMPFQTNMALTVGTLFTNNIIVTNTGADPGAYFELTNSAHLDSGQIGKNATTTVCLPPGITLKCYDNVSATQRWFYAAIYGTPTTPSATAKVNVDAGFSGAGDIFTNIFFTVVSGASRPVITNQPASVTNVAGGNAAFSVVVGGTAPLTYQWRLFTTNYQSSATNSSLNFTNLRLSQAGDYTVVITNIAGSVTSSVSTLAVTIPPLPVLVPTPAAGNFFQFTFVPVVGLTNTVETNETVNASWIALTNIPPPASAASITVTDSISGNARFYRVKINP
jgi:hypothetical protein